MRDADHTGLRIGEQHRQAVGGEHAQGHACTRSHLRIGFDHAHASRGMPLIVLRAGEVVSERGVPAEHLVHVHGLAGVHLRNDA